MTRQEIPAELLRAKRLAVAQYLTREAARRAPPVYATSVHPRHNLVGIGIGRKLTKGKPSSARCVRFYLERKIDRKLIPRDLLLPPRMGGVATDVIETGRLRAFLPIPSGRKRLRPARPGCSVSFQFPDSQPGMLTAGTFGALVEREGARYILSNNHVLANENALPPGSPIFQPGLLDGGSPASDQIARLAHFVPLTATDHNRVDCALAEVIEATGVRAPVLPKVGRLSSPDPIDAVDGMRVEKTGRTTGYTTGTVFDVSATVTVHYDLGDLIFEDQILIRADPGSFSDVGDSGALIVDQASGRGTGLLIGGAAEFTIANHLGDVLAALNARLVI